MPDDNGDTSGAKRAGLRKMAQFIKAEVRRYAPTQQSADSFYVDESGGNVSVVSNDTGTVAAERNWRRPLFGDRDYWSATNKYHPGRTHFVDRAVDRAANYAAEKFLDEYLQVITRTSAIWEESD